MVGLPGDGNEGNEGTDLRQISLATPTTFPFAPPSLDPLNGQGATFPLLLNRAYRCAFWGATWRAQVVLAEFGKNAGWQDIAVDPPKLDPTSMQAEIRALLDHIANDRPRLMSEIVLQANGASAYFGNMLDVDATCRPNTWAVITCTFTVGQMVAMFFKSKFNRARPSHVYPAVLPVISTPTHPSYPSGHSVQSWLTAYCLSEVCADLQLPAEGMAERIASNREVAGLHFPSDTQAGKAIAERVKPFLMGCPTFINLLTAAKGEWQPDTVPASGN
jgi:acid phosphatase (class A)